MRPVRIGCSQGSFEIKSNVPMRKACVVFASAYLFPSVEVVSRLFAWGRHATATRGFCCSRCADQRLCLFHLTAPTPPANTSAAIIQNIAMAPSTEPNAPNTIGRNT
jgi:hypothetical protein